jgi:hypothetical protein
MTVPVGRGEAFCAVQHQALDLSVNLMPCLLNIESFLISSGPIASQLFLEIGRCIPLSLQSVSSHLISFHLISRRVFSAFFIHLISSHIISSNVFSSNLSFAQLITTFLISSHVS